MELANRKSWTSRTVRRWSRDLLCFRTPIDFGAVRLIGFANGAMLREHLAIMDKSQVLFGTRAMPWQTDCTPRVG
jgi:hypothetical protein